MLRDQRILQGLTLCQAAFAWEAAQVIRGLTQGQATGRVTSVNNALCVMLKILSEI
jgi:hypothetical protein